MKMQKIGHEILSLHNTLSKKLFLSVFLSILISWLFYLREIGAEGSWEGFWFWSVYMSGFNYNF